MIFFFWLVWGEVCIILCFSGMNGSLIFLLLFKRLPSPEFILSFNLSLKLFVLQYIFWSSFQVYGIVRKGQIEDHGNYHLWSVYYVQVALYLISHLIYLANLKGRWCYLHFTDERFTFPKDLPPDLSHSIVHALSSIGLWGEGKWSGYKVFDLNSHTSLTLVTFLTLGSPSTVKLNLSLLVCPLLPNPY